MAEDVENQEEEAPAEENLDDFYANLGLTFDEDEETPPEEPEAGDAEQAEYDQKLSKLEKKLDRKAEDLEKKFRVNITQQRVSAFVDKADELERTIFKALVADVKDPETADRAIALVKERAAKMREEAQKYTEKMQAEAEEAAAKAWGTGPVGRVAPGPAEDEVKAAWDNVVKGGPGSWEDSMRLILAAENPPVKK